MNAAMAIEYARKEVRQLALSSGDQFELLLDETKEVEQGWLFFFNTADFVRTRNPVNALAGNGPVFVSREGKILHLPSAMPWKQALNDIVDEEILN